MPTDTNVKQVIINKLTKAQYDAATKNPTELYLTPDEPASTTNLGPVKVDGTTITAAADGTIAANTAGLSTMTGATSSAAGAKGLVPAPAAGDESKFLRGDGTWVGSTSSTAWGAITGTLSDQTDLQTALDAKQATISDLSTIRSGASAGATAVQPGSLATVATSGSYADLSNKPTNVSAFANDAGYLTSHQDITGKADADLSNVSATSGFRKLKEVYINGTSWYKVFEEYDPSTGNYIGDWCEQGGSLTPATSGNTTQTITFLKPFADTNYSLTGSAQENNNNANVWASQMGCSWETKSTTYFTRRTYQHLYEWRACGYIS